MTYKDFINKHNIKNNLFNINFQEDLIKVLDMLYINYTKEQIVDLINDYYDNADNIVATLSFDYIEKYIDENKNM